MTRDSAANHYATVEVQTGVTDASPHALILMLFEGAIIAIGLAREHMLAGNVVKKGEALSKALAIIDEGLRASLDKSVGGEIAENLDALYEYMSTRLIEANIHNQVEPLDEVVRIMSEIKSAWEEIGPQKAAITAIPQDDPPEPAKRAPQSYGTA